MNLSGSKALLTDSTRELLTRWHQTRASWNDRKAREFEETWIDGLAETLSHAVRVIDELEKLLGKVHADCE
jgi:hypothetical protein